jgi:phosphoribosylglycinamide formyltransferase 2
MKPALLEKAQLMAQTGTEALGGAGIFGVEFFIGENDVWFSELSPRPHDTGMVTLAGTQNLNQFELHARAVLGLPIPQIELLSIGASSVLLSDKEVDHTAEFEGLNKALENERTSVYNFGKPSQRPYRRMGVVLVYDALEADIQKVVAKAKSIASKIIVQ